MDKDIFNHLKNSECKQKKQFYYSNDPKIFSDERNVVPSDFFISNLVIRNFFTEKYFDPSKNTNIINRISKEERIFLLKLYKQYLVVKIFPNNQNVDSSLVDNSKKSIFAALSKYISDKYSYDKTRYRMNSKYYRESSKLDLKDLKKYIDDHESQDKSLVKYSSDHGVSYSTVRMAVKRTLNYVYARKEYINKNRNSSNNKRILEVYLLKRHFLSQNSIKYIYIDESSFNNKKRCAKKWVRRSYFNSPLNNGRIKSINLILAVTNNKVISFFLNYKNNNSSHFKIFLRNLLNKLRNDDQYKDDYKNSRFCLFMDNCTLHKAKEIKFFLQKTGLNVIFCPPYHPDINSVEYSFRRMKKFFYSSNIRTL